MKRLAVRLLSAFAAAAVACGCAYGQAPAGARAGREVAVTVDDLPATHGDLAKMREITSKLLGAFRRHNVPAVAFVNESRLYVRGEMDERTELLRSWLDAGHELGNHTFSHISIDRNPLAAYREDVIRGETVTRMLLAERGRKLRYFRHTQLRTGPNEEYRRGLSEFLAARGYTVAPVTVDNQEWVFAHAYARAAERGDAEMARRVSSEYLRYMEEVFDFFERLSADFLGYEVKQTLLLHANELNADHFDALAAVLERRGYSFVTLERALTDKAYALPEAQADTGLSWLHRWMLAKGLKMRPEPREPRWVTELFRAGQQN
ncbi:MAG TPA: polysaccharide deacetylase family protein [Pyrinomonadaceae bacterium]|nr:polysaccharide deacetylase family protein [Pyrinomonadaceae bacterium]